MPVVPGKLADIEAGKKLPSNLMAHKSNMKRFRRSSCSKLPNVLSNALVKLLVFFIEKLIHGIQKLCLGMEVIIESAL